MHNQTDFSQSKNPDLLLYISIYQKRVSCSVHFHKHSPINIWLLKFTRIFCWLCYLYLTHSHVSGMPAPRHDNKTESINLDFNVWLSNKTYSICFHKVTSYSLSNKSTATNTRTWFSPVVIHGYWKDTVWSKRGTISITIFVLFASKLIEHSYVTGRANTLWQ